MNIKPKSVSIYSYNNGRHVFIYTRNTSPGPLPNTQRQTQTHLDLSQYPSVLPIFYINKATSSAELEQGFAYSTPTPALGRRIHAPAAISQPMKVFWRESIAVSSFYYCFNGFGFFLHTYAYT